MFYLVTIINVFEEFVNKKFIFFQIFFIFLNNHTEIVESLGEICYSSPAKIGGISIPPYLLFLVISSSICILRRITRDCTDCYPVIYNKSFKG